MKLSKFICQHKSTGAMFIQKSAPDWLKRIAKYLYKDANPFQQDFILKEIKKVCKYIDDKYVSESDPLSIADACVEFYSTPDDQTTSMTLALWFLMMHSAPHFSEAEEFAHYDHPYEVSIINNIKCVNNYYCHYIYETVALEFIQNLPGYDK